MYLFIFRERKNQEEREAEKHWCVRKTLVSCLSHILQQGTGLPSNQQRYDWELNRWLYAFWNNAQPTEPRWSGHCKQKLSYNHI